MKEREQCKADDQRKSKQGYKEITSEVSRKIAVALQANIPPWQTQPNAHNAIKAINSKYR